MEPKMYIEDLNFKMPGGYLPETLYSQALNSIIMVCADVVFVNKASKTLWLATRIAKPIPGPWIVGGRIQAGEQPRKGACNKVKKETGLELLPERLEYVSMYRFINSERQQDPQEGGSDTLSYIYAVEVSPHEIATAASGLDEKEYDRTQGLRPFRKEDLQNNETHPALLDIYEDIFDL